MRFISYAQNAEDVLLWRALQDVEAGFYIDVGAAHPIHDSVTKAFYERGWHGINIDPDPEAMTHLRATRPRDTNLQLGVAAHEGQCRFYGFPGTGWSTLSGDVAERHKAHGSEPKEQLIQAQTLSAICDSHVTGEIHFLKIDVEGFEAQVIASGDFARFRPWIILIEATVPNSAEQVPREWEPALTAAGYKFAHFDGLNCYYVASEQAERLLPRLATEANIFDNYISVHNIEEAQTAADDGVSLPGLISATTLEQAERRARVSESRAERAEAKARDIELRLLTLETELHLLRADAAKPVAIIPDERRAIQPAASDPPGGPGAQRLFFDATLILRHGFLSAVGIVRVEHYVAEYLARDPSVALEFVTFDAEHKSYRAVTEQERDFLEQILFHRYKTATSDPTETETTTDVWVPQSIGVQHWHWLQRRIRLAASLKQAEFGSALIAYAARRLPVRAEHSAPRRVVVRLVRRAFLATARTGYSVLPALAAIRQRLSNPIRRMVAPDPDTSSPRPTAAGQAFNFDPFEAGDVLLSMSNTWDYMDYRYLAKLRRHKGVRLIFVVYDVVGMEIPFVTPAPAHLYHRHWVEIGHVSERLIAISQFSAESYRRFIADPNGIDVPIDHALLPNFLKERAAEIGETAVDELMDQNFVVYCSSIEIRKNHILLLHLWEELRQRIGPDKLPILVFVGKWAWSAETVRLVSERNWRLRPHLRILTETSDAELIWLYRRARFTVFPSLTEGFGLAAAESLSFGTPVVTSDCPALLEATERLMPALHPHDFTGWLKELERLILDDDYLDIMREKASQFRGAPYDAFVVKIRDAALNPLANVDSPPAPPLAKAQGL